MDDLEKSASAHCSHLSPSGRDWLLKMVDILMGQSELPIAFRDRLELYKEHKIPEGMLLYYDSQALMTAYERRTNAKPS